MRAQVLLLVTMVSACHLREEGAPCPCSEGWTCCQPANVCSQSCEAVGSDAGGGGDGTAAEADASEPRPDARPGSGSGAVIYLNFEGVGITQGAADDATANVSSMGAGTIPAFDWTIAHQLAIVSLVSSYLSPFRVEVVLDRPATGPYAMVVIGGRAADLGLPGGVLGIAAQDCEADPVDRSIAFVFSEEFPVDDYEGVALSVADQLGHGFGLSHVDRCEDVMDPVGSCGDKSFFDHDAPCAGAGCACGGSSQNSFVALTAILGDS
jgi:hypothetical protein